MVFFTLTLSEELADRFCHATDGNHLDFILPGVNSLHIMGGDEDALESQLLRFRYTLLDT